MKPRSQWGPLDEFVWVFTNTALIVFGLAFVAAFGFGVATAVMNKIKIYEWHESWNSRGYVRCIDGAVEIGNIDFDKVKLAHPAWDCDK